MFEQHTTAESPIIQWRKLRQNAETEQDVLDPSRPRLKIPSDIQIIGLPKSGPIPFVIVEEGYFCAQELLFLVPKH